MSRQSEPDDGLSLFPLPEAASGMEARYLPPPQVPTLPETNLMATLALVGFLVAGVVPGLVLGHIALSQIKRTRQLGRGRALTVVILSYFILGLIVTIVSISLIAHRH
ncbi:MAG: Nuclease [Subtercola sp.]|nr:Nuclease [Subtercola sp.]